MKSLIQYIKEDVFDLNKKFEIIKGVTTLGEYYSKEHKDSKWNEFLCKDVTKDTLYVDTGGMTAWVYDDEADLLANINKLCKINNFDFGRFAMNFEVEEHQNFNGIHIINENGFSKLHIPGNGRTKTFENLEISKVFGFEIDINSQPNDVLLRNIKLIDFGYIDISIGTPMNGKQKTDFENVFISARTIRFHDNVPNFDEKCGLEAKDDINILISDYFFESIINGELGIDEMNENINLEGINSNMKKTITFMLRSQDRPKGKRCELIHKTNPKYKAARTGLSVGDWKLTKIKK